MRVGVRMGTCGRDGYSSASSHSNPDYTSSSEQSCDTVIYVGPNGQALSDRELTDNEGPPCRVPIMPRTQSLPRPSRMVNQHIEENIYESIEPEDGELDCVTPTKQPKCGIASVGTSPIRHHTGGSPRREPPQVGAVGASPVHSIQGMVQPPQRMGKAKVSHHTRQQHQGVYDPRYPYREGPVGEAAPGSEQWVDGPGAPQTQPHEHWIDGPIRQPQPSWMNESYVYNGEGQPIPINNSGLVKPSGEQWVDGPMEFVSDDLKHNSPGHKLTKAEKAHRMWKQMSAGKPLPPPRAHSLENWTPQYKSQVPHRDESDLHRERERHRERRHERRPRDLEQPKTGDLSRLRSSEPTEPLSVPSVEGSDNTNASMTVQTSLGAASDKDAKVKQDLTEENLPNRPVKSFVRDWVEKHSMTPESQSVETTPEHSPSKHNSSRHKTKEPKNPTISDMLYGNETNEVSSSAHSSPKTPRKHKSKKHTHPKKDSAQDRITQWVQSVHEATSHLPGESEVPFSPNSEEPISEELLAPECDQAMLFDSKSPPHPMLFDSKSPPPPYESCVENPEDIMLDNLDDDIPDVEQPYLDQENNETIEIIKSSEIGSKPILRLIGNNSTVDKDSFDQGLETVEKSSTISDMKNAIESPITTAVNDNRDSSIYEHDMDEEMAKIETDSNLNNTFTSEEETASNTNSLQNKDIDEVLDNSPLVLQNEALIQNEALQVSHNSDEGVADDTLTVDVNREASSPEVKSKVELSPLSVNADVDSGNASAHSGEHLSPLSSNDDSEKVTRGRNICRPSHLRRPDGASNPNIASLIEPSITEKTASNESDEVLKIPPPVLPKPLYSSTPSATSTVCHVSEDGISPIKRSVLGQSPENSSKSELTQKPSSKLPTKLPTPKDSSSSKSKTSKEKDSKDKSKSTKPSILPKPFSRKSKSADRADSASMSPSSKPSIPSRFSSKSSTSSRSSKSSSGSTSPNKSSSQHGQRSSSRDKHTGNIYF